MAVPQHRIAMLQMIEDGFEPNRVILFQFKDFFRQDEIYKWLIQNKFTGKKFYEFAKTFNFGKASMAQEIFSRIDHWKKESIRVGKDLK